MSEKISLDSSVYSYQIFFGYVEDIIDTSLISFFCQSPKAGYTFMKR